MRIINKFILIFVTMNHKRSKHYPISFHLSSGFVISWTALTIDEGYGGLAGGRQVDILGGSGGGKSWSEWLGLHSLSTEAILICDDCREWTIIGLLKTMFILVEFADNVDVVAVVMFEAVLEWLIFIVAVLDVGGLVFGVIE